MIQEHELTLVHKDGNDYRYTLYLTIRQSGEAYALRVQRGDESVDVTFHLNPEDRVAIVRALGYAAVLA